MNTNVSLVFGDITHAKTDAIVNAANAIMLGGGGVDGAIHRAAGPKLLEECKKVKKIGGVRCPAGEARITLAADLPCKYVIHTVGPIYRKSSNPRSLLESAYRESLNLVRKYKLGSVAFPAISCGSYGYPLEEAARIAISESRAEVYSELDIFFYLYPEKVFDVWRNVMAILNAENSMP